ncbi:MAG TPA: PadR family transcriptional regulator [Ktedonobacteraceae bacterium]|nr:PadR family transcriptional regulator [Ktedonobacteraceae bacterium]
MDISTLGYALLAILARGPLSGYDLAQRMKKPIGFFWQSQLSQIYPELAHLEAQGCVTHKVIVQEDRPQKKVYTITDAGSTALKAWVTRSPTPPPERNELLLKTYAIWLADSEAAIELFRTQEQMHAERLALYEHDRIRIEQESGRVPHPHEPLFGNYATVRMGIAYEHEYVEWCHWMAEQFELALASQLQDSQ